MIVAVYIFLFVALLGCGNATTVHEPGRDSVLKKTFDSSAIMNDATQLPQDSTNTGVMH